MSKKIIVVDDSKTVRTVLSTTLSNAGYQIVEAEDGNDALSKIADNPIDALITDLNMPTMCGIELIKAVRAGGGNRFTPIIMLTSETSPELKMSGKAAGASAWINKPFDPTQILSVVSMVCPIERKMAQ